jgi:hypothetical protein
MESVAVAVAVVVVVVVVQPLAHTLQYMILQSH